MTKINFNKPIQNSKDLITKEAFKLFIEKNIEKVTVPELEMATKLQRGAIFYHFKDKQSIFEEVIKQYFFSPLNFLYPIEVKDVQTLEEYWEKKYNYIKTAKDWFINENIKVNQFFAFLHLAEQGTLYINDFNKRIEEMIGQNTLYWHEVVTKSKCNTNYNIGHLYNCLYLGECLINSNNNNKDVDFLIHSFFNLHKNPTKE